MRNALPLLALVLACSPPADDTAPPKGDSTADTETPGETGESGETGETDETGSGTETGDTGDTSEPVEPAWGEGPLSVSGQVYFFDMQNPGTLDWIRDVEGAEVYVLEAPQLRATLDPAEDHRFVIDGIPEGVELTLAAVHEDYFPHLTATLPVGDSDIEGITFQSVSRTIATLAAALLGADANDQSRCQMATTVSALGAENVWAPGEPGAIVTTDPVVPAESGPFYFDESVIPDRSLTETTTDGGVIVVGAEPGTYLWDAHKDGVVFEQLKLECVGGWLTNASPPFGLNVLGSDG